MIPFTHEQVLITNGPRSGRIMSVAVHSTRLGQALGGARLWQYDSWTDAVADALRLSAAMTLKNAAAGLNRGGGKSVIYLPVGTVLTDAQKRDAMLDLGDAIDSLGGVYMTAEDVGTSAELMAIVAERTEHVCGLPVNRAESASRLTPPQPASTRALSRRPRPCSAAARSTAATS